MSFLARFTRVLLTIVVRQYWDGQRGRAQEAKVTFLSPADSVQKRGSAPGMKVKLISNGEGLKQ
jgi:hypothetical protein